MRQTRPIARVLVGISVVCALAVFGCSSKEEDCTSLRTYFSDQIWGPVLAKNCLACHGPGGRAQAENAQLRLLPASYPGFLDINLSSIREVARLESEGQSALVLKPLGALNHGGGQVIQRGSAEHAALTQLAQKLKAGASDCADPATGFFTDAALLDARATLRKATLNLAGRLPKPEELARIAAPAPAGGEAALRLIIAEVMEEPAFYERVKEIYNDLLLTDRYMSYTGRAVGLLDGRDWPGRGAAYYDPLSDADKYYVNKAIAREPLELIAYVVKKNKPFTDILGADYTVVNPYSAKLYGVEGMTFEPNSPDNFQEAKLSFLRNDARVSIPHAGVLTTATFLNRFPSTPTNRNRHRARIVLEKFLATDILKVADRPIDPTAATRYPNPTREDPACATCHRTIDPIAGAFQKFDDNDPERLMPTRTWYSEMFAPGWDGEQMMTSDIDRAPAWLAERLVRDARFVQSTVETMYRALTGAEPAEYPADASAPDYSARLRAWKAQDEEFRRIGAAFKEGRTYSFKVLIRELVTSPLYRIVSTKTAPSASRALELDAFGPGRLLTPEMLSRKLAALFEGGWVRSYDRRQYLLEEYKILFGGHDSDVVTKRLTIPNGIMAGVMLRMANEVACTYTAYDFTKPVTERSLFPGVSLQHEPEAVTGDPVPGAIVTIREAIRALYERIIGDPLPDADPEVNRIYGLFLETWREGKAAVARSAEPEDLPYACQGRVDPRTGTELPQASRISRDRSYTVRAWMAVVTYILLDYRFLHE